MALVPKSGDNLLFDIGREGAVMASFEIEEANPADINVEYMPPHSLSVDEQAALVRSAIQAEKDGIIVSCIDDDSISKLVDEAVAAGIPVLTYDSDCPSSKRFAHFSMANDDAGRTAAQLLDEAMEADGAGPKQVVILSGQEASQNLRSREEGIRDWFLEQRADVKVIETVRCQETAEDCGEKLEQALQVNPDLDGLLVLGLWGLEAACLTTTEDAAPYCHKDQMRFWKDASDGGLKTVAFDSLPFQLELVRQGYVSALIGQKYFDWGYRSVQLMFEHLSGQASAGASPNTVLIDSGFDVVCLDNVEEMEDRWWLTGDFKEPLSSCSL